MIVQPICSSIASIPKTHAELLALATTPNTPLAILGVYDYNNNFDSIVVSSLEGLRVGDTVTITGHGTENGDWIVKSIHTAGDPVVLRIVFTTDFNAQPPAVEGYASWQVGTMVPEQLYLITNFASEIPGLYTGTTEPLLVRAHTTRDLYPDARSALYPQDIIRYDLQYTGPTVFTYGKITYREDTIWDVSAYSDFRNYWSLMYETSEGSGIFTKREGDYGRGSASQLMPMFNPFWLGTDGVKAVHIGFQDTGHAPIVFNSIVTKTEIGPNQDLIAFWGSVSDSTMGGCCLVECQVGASSLRMSGSGTFRSTNTAYNVTIENSGYVHTTGAWNGVQVFSGYSLGTVSVPDTANRTNELIGYPLSAYAPLANPVFTDSMTVPIALTGVLRADAGVMSVDPMTAYPLLAGRAGGQTLIGGTGTTDDLILRTTSGVGTTGADMIFQTGNNGGTEAMRILNDGRIRIKDLAGYSDDNYLWVNIGLKISTPYPLTLTSYNRNYLFSQLCFSPGADNDVDIGSSLSRFKDLYLAGNVGIGTTSPTARLHLPAGTATASTAPLKFTTGVSLTTAEAGAMEFTTDDLFFTITTGAARKHILLDGVGFAGGTMLIGDTASGGNLTLQSTSHATKGKILFGTSAYDEVNNRLGIGTVSPATNLDIVGPTGVTTFTGTTKLGFVTRGSTGTTDYSGIDFIGNGATTPIARIAILSGSGGSFLKFGTSNTYISGITNTAMVIDPNGYIGINKTNPFTFLDIEVSEVPAILISGDNTNKAGIGIRNGETKALDFYAGSAAAANLQAGDIKMSILTGGNVGFNNTNPTSRIHAVDTVNAGSGSLAAPILELAQTWNTTGTIPGAIRLIVTDTASNAASLLFNLQTAGAPNVTQFSVSKGGNLIAAGTATIAGAFGCNGATAQTAYASGGAVTTAAGAFGFSSDAERASLTTLVANIRLALVANGTMT